MAISDITIFPAEPPYVNVYMGPVASEPSRTPGAALRRLARSTNVRRVTSEWRTNPTIERKFVKITKNRASTLQASPHRAEESHRRTKKPAGKFLSIIKHISNPNSAHKSPLDDVHPAHEFHRAFRQRFISQPDQSCSFRHCSYPRTSHRPRPHHPSCRQGSVRSHRSLEV